MIGTMSTSVATYAEEAPSVSDLRLLLEEPLRNCGAISAYLGGLYVRTDRHGYARRSDEIVLFAVAESLPARHVDRYEQFRLAMKAAEGISLYPVLRAYTQKEIDNAGGLETALALTFDDWDKIL